MATTHPDLASEYLGDPTMVVAGANRMFDWRCALGHEWRAAGGTRVNMGTGCPSCALPGLNPEAPTILYAVRDHEILKVGVTNDTNADKRLRQHANQGLREVLYVCHFDTGWDAYAAERLWVSFLRSRPEHRVDKTRLRDGHTEAIYVHEGVLGFALELATLGREGHLNGIIRGRRNRSRSTDPPTPLFD